MDNRFRFRCLLLASSLILGGCGSDDSSDPTILEGSWSQGCTPTEDNEAEKYNLSFSGNNFTAKEQRFNDTSCEQKRVEIVLSGSLSLGEKVTLSQSGQSVYRAQWQINKLEISYSSKEMITQLNEAKRCGFANWEVNTFKDVTTCDSLNTDRVHKDLVKVDGNNVFFGDTDNVGSDGYPTQLKDKYYSKD